MLVGVVNILSTDLILASIKNLSLLPQYLEI